MTNNEDFMLRLLDSGTYDGIVGRAYYDERGFIIGYFIVGGLPEKTIARPSLSSGDTNSIGIQYDRPRTVKRYRTDEQRLLFLKQYGHYINDNLFQEYSTTSGLAIDLPTTYQPPCNSPHPQRTSLEVSLLARLAAGEFDGYKGNYWWPNATFWCTIENGSPIRWKQNPGTKVFNGKENEYIPGKISIYRKYLTDDEKLEFFQKFGWEMTDQEAVDYSWDARQRRYNR